MLELTIDGKNRLVAPGTTLLEAAREMGVLIPTLCHLEGAPAHPSCLVCVVEELKTGRLLPACAARAEAGMQVRTGGETVTAARRSMLELLLAGHRGDCLAPCRRACPLGVNIQEVLRLVAEERFLQAGNVLAEDLALPRTSAWLCPAPCEKVCRQGDQARPVSIRQLHRQLAGLTLEIPVPGRCATGQRTAVVGAGPAGLAAAFHLLRAGHACTLFDSNPSPGGSLRGQLPPALLAADLDRLREMGLTFCSKTGITREFPVSRLRGDFQAIVLAAGSGQEALVAAVGGTGSLPDGLSGASPDLPGLPGVFIAGHPARRPTVAVRAMAAGRRAAEAADRYLRGEVSPVREASRSYCHSRKPDRPPKTPAARQEPAVAAGPAAAIWEASRCLQCGCGKAEACLLRQLATEYGIRPNRTGGGPDPSEIHHIGHSRVIFEPGKCILCGRCVRIADAAGEPVGLALVGRGHELRVAPPLGASWEGALTTSADRCAAACPTGAMVLRDQDPGLPDAPSGHRPGFPFLTLQLLLLLLLVTAMACGGHPAAERAAAGPGAPACWPVFRGSPELAGVAAGALPESPRRRWVFQAGDEIRSSPVVADGQVFFGCSDQRLYALDLETGRPSWSLDLGAPMEAPPLLGQGMLYIGDLDGKLHAVDIRTQREKWVYAAGGKIVGSANRAAQAGKEILLVASYDSKLHCLDSASGALRWTFDTASYIQGAPAVWRQHAVFGGCDACLHVLTLDDGRETAEVDLGKYVAASPAVSADHAFIGNYLGQLFKVDLSGGAVRWMYQDPAEPASFFSSPAVGGGAVVVGGRDGRVHCVDAVTGKGRWTFRTRGDVDGSPVIAGERVAATSMDGRIYLLRLTDGTVEWSWDVGRPIASSPAVAGGFIIFGDTGGSLHAFGPDI